MAQLTITVPDSLVPRVLAALRGTYPTLTDDLGDRDAAQAVIREMVRSAVVSYETQQARNQLVDSITAAEADARNATATIT